MILRRFLAAWLVLAAGAAQGQALESVFAPGPLIAGHAKLEAECRSCHVPFKRAAQNGLCLDCHKDVASDVRGKRGMHGQLPPQDCRACHTDHRGRDARIAQVNERSFDHAQTDFALLGAHAAPGLQCRSCHVSGRKFRDAPGRCVDCHAKQDVHKGRLGPKCADCHTEESWKQARFDHDRTRFPLRGRHAPLKCASCHKNDRFQQTPTACVACHRADDTHKGRYGDKCESCHVDRDWKALVFDHDRDTRYPLRGKHRALRCDSCHTGHLYRDKLQGDCAACHRKDDKHKGTLGAACGDCHGENSWKVARFDHAKTRFPLRGKHAGLDCKSCHKSQVFKEALSACIACHRKDDRHKGALGDACGKCHSERNWKDSSFDHAKTAFPLLGRHASAKCESCHRDPNYKRTPKDCLGCHAKEDVHDGQLGPRCESCHDATHWKRARFDHGQTRFALLGRHQLVACGQCHASKRYRDAKRECFACHGRDDVHKRRLGPACESCHNARAWKAWDFDHARQTRFALDGAHRKLDCHACHRKSVDKRPSLPSSCVSCHAGDDVHDGSFGRQCERCHVTSTFRQIKQRLGMSGWPR